MTSNQSIPSDPAAIEREIRERQVTLASTVDELMERVKPKNLVETAKQSAKDRALEFVGVAKDRGRNAADNAKVKLNDAAATAKEKASTAQQAASDKVGFVRSGSGSGGYSAGSTGGTGTSSSFVDTAQTQARQAVTAAKSSLTDDQGNTDQARVATVAAGTASAILFLAWLASRGE